MSSSLYRRSAIEEIAAQAHTAPPGARGAGIAGVDLKVVAPLFWAWFRNNGDRKVYTIKVWIINKTIYVRDLRPVFEMLFGPEGAIL